MRRVVVIVIVLAVVVAAFAIAWASTGWPGICLAHGWCDPAGFLARFSHHN